MKVTKVIEVAKDFSKFPGGRYLTDGPHSGQRFREDFLVPALNTTESVTIELDGTLGYGSSFLEEAFGGLVRESGFSGEKLRSALCFKSRDSSLPGEIWDYISRAQPRRP